MKNDEHANDYYFEARMSSSNRIFKDGLRADLHNTRSKNSASTVPPTFFDTDAEKWNKKFESTIKDRSSFKNAFKKHDDKEKQFM